ncbi:MAG: hypothetical protein HC846_11400 [Blastocatellia bacterium]|nr:hypothetical protein [Blastocatellia bacterium]
MPDEVIKPTTVPIERARQQQKLLDPIFAFSLDLSFGKVAGYDSYKVDRAITYNYNLKANEFPVTETLFQDFKKFAVNQYKIPASLVDKEREFIERNLRSELVIAAYGITTSTQVFREVDNQLLRAIELLPKAKQLALEAAKVKTTAEFNK